MKGFVVEIKEANCSRIIDIVPELSEDKSHAWQLVKTNTILVEKTQLSGEAGLSFLIRMSKIADKIRTYFRRSAQRP